MYEGWLKKQAEKIFKNKVTLLARLLKVKPNKIVVKKLKNRWGSVSQKGTINFNTR